MDIQEKSGISVAKDHGVTTAKKFNKMKSKYGNDYTISVDKSGKVTKKKKNKSESRKKGMSLRKARRKAHTSGADRNLTKTKKSSLYKRLYGGKNEEINMEELIKYDPSDDISALFDGGAYGNPANAQRESNEDPNQNTKTAIALAAGG